MVSRDLAGDKEYDGPQPGPPGRVFGGSGETSEQVLRLSLGARSLQNLVAFKERSNETCVLFDAITAGGGAVCAACAGAGSGKEKAGAGADAFAGGAGGLE